MYGKLGFQTSEIYFFMVFAIVIYITVDVIYIAVYQKWFL